MYKIKIKIKKSYTHRIEIIQELIQADSRYSNIQKNNYFNTMIKFNHNNILDILNYLEPDLPISKDSEYVEKNILIHQLTYSSFQNIAKLMHITHQNYLKLLLEKFYQLDTNVEFLTLKLYKGDKFYFLNEETLKIFIYENYFSTSFLLDALKLLKQDDKENRTTFIFFRIMQMYAKRLVDEKKITTSEYNFYLEAYKDSKIIYEIDFIEKIIFLRHKLKTDFIVNKRTRILKDIISKYNKKFTTEYEKNVKKFICNEIYPYYSDTIEHIYDVFSLGNFKQRLQLSGDNFLIYSDNLTTLLEKNQFKPTMYQSLENIDSILNYIAKMKLSHT